MPRRAVLKRGRALTQSFNCEEGKRFWAALSSLSPLSLFFLSPTRLLSFSIDRLWHFSLSLSRFLSFSRSLWSSLSSSEPLG